ncbi:D-alanyl-D-alanine carboxypeptidase/D-alanyl-D-alanine endopeptidase [Citricoccus sp. CH26A]|uniref:D-alanyl-D-alanine carboxypeptidase/D-alanyl-D-alanine endopeptidase n=1 Tax=Citricoccus TaxID=169133 RepID=UPI00114560EB|nr:D-alanyl-D-alanine carboxypeptidase/D-alanyl-D-alanine-endopeptidase [Citricoccus sp. CH26A]
MTSRPPRHRPAVRAIPRTLGAALALLLAGTVTGCQVQDAQTGAAPSGPTPALAVSSTITAGAASSSTSASSPASASDPSSPATPTSSSSPGRPAATGPQGASEGGPTLAAVLGLSGLTALLDPMPDPEALAPALDEALAVSSGTLSAAVVDVLTGEVLYDRSADEPAVPASAVKILTGLAALEVLGPDHRYTTGAVALPGRVGDQDVTHVVLDAGGDVLLGTGSNATSVDGRAGLGTLARHAAEELATRGTSGTVTVRLDDSGYTGPKASPDWSPDIVPSGNVSAVQPIATHGGRPSAGTGTNRLHDPALYAAEVFRDHLARHARDLDIGIRVSDSVGRLSLKGRGSELASVRSATVAQQVTHMLKTSDNQVAEATGRNLALAAGEDGSFDGASRVIEEAVSGLGVDTAGLDLVDASGLSGRNRVSPLQLTESLGIAAGDPGLEAAATGLPVAGKEGTLEHRMVGTPAQDVVRAKTGTLSSVASLTGTVRTADERQLVFSFIANDQPGVLTDARFAVDRAAVLLAGCGCRADAADPGS